MTGARLPENRVNARSKAVPKQVNGRRFSGKSSAEFFEYFVHRDKYLVKSLDIFLVVRTVVAVFRKRRFRRSFVGHCPDLRLYSELCQICENAFVEIGDAQAVIKIEIFVSAAAGVDLKLVLDKVELDLEIAAVVWDGVGRQATRADVKRNVPPVVNSRMRF